MLAGVLFLQGSDWGFRRTAQNNQQPKVESRKVESRALQKQACDRVAGRRVGICRILCARCTPVNESGHEVTWMGGLIFLIPLVLVIVLAMVLGKVLASTMFEDSDDESSTETGTPRMDKSNRVAQVYGYVVCLVAVITVLLLTSRHSQCLRHCESVGELSIGYVLWRRARYVADLVRGMASHPNSCTEGDGRRRSAGPCLPTAGRPFPASPAPW